MWDWSEKWSRKRIKNEDAKLFYGIYSKFPILKKTIALIKHYEFKLFIIIIYFLTLFIYFLPSFYIYSVSVNKDFSLFIVSLPVIGQKFPNAPISPSQNCASQNYTFSFWNWFFEHVGYLKFEMTGKLYLSFPDSSFSSDDVDSSLKPTAKQAKHFDDPSHWKATRSFVSSSSSSSSSSSLS